MDSGWLRIDLLTRDHDRSSFHCGEPTLDDYLHRFANQQQKNRHAAVYVATDRRSPEKIIGYYTLSANAVQTERLRGVIGSNLPAYELTPTTLLGRLAVDQSAQGRGLGSYLLADALVRALVQSSIIGSHAIVVDALNDDVGSWYESHGFKRFADHQLQLVMPMKVVKQLFQS